MRSLILMLFAVLIAAASVGEVEAGSRTVVRGPFGFRRVTVVDRQPAAFVAPLPFFAPRPVFVPAPSVQSFRIGNQLFFVH